MASKYAKRHYEDVARILKGAFIPYHDPEAGASESTVEMLTDDFVKLFKSDNPRFDEQRFRDACNA